MAKSFSIAGAVGKSQDLTFITKAAKVEARIVDVKNDSFRVIWTTDETTDSIIEYKNLNTNGLNKKIDPAKKIYHEMIIENLTPATTYEVKVSGYNKMGNLIEAKEALRVTTSKDITPPIISALKIDSALVPGRTDRIQTIVSWKTDEPATSIVSYEEGSGLAKKELANKVEIPNNWVSDHVVILTNLKPGVIYKVEITSVDTVNNKAVLPIRTIITPKPSESIFDVIIKNFEDTFKFLKEVR